MSTTWEHTPPMRLTVLHHWREVAAPVVMFATVWVLPWKALGALDAPLLLLLLLAILGHYAGWRGGLAAALMLALGAARHEATKNGSWALPAAGWDDLATLAMAAGVIGFLTGRPAKGQKDGSNSLAAWEEQEGIEDDRIRIDPLTGLPNARVSMQLLETEWMRWRRFATPFSVLLVEIDGYSEWQRKDAALADAIVRAVAGAITASIRSLDFAGRTDGGRFILTLPQTHAAGVTVVGNKLLQRLRDTVIEYAGERTVSITCSAGSSTVERVDGRYRQVLERAQASLAQARAAGGDQLMRADPAPPQRVRG